MAQKNIIKKNQHAEAYVYNNTSEFVYNTADVWHTFYGSTQGHICGWSFFAGSIGTISAFVDYSGTVTGTVKATDVAHGLITGAIVNITGTTNYNGIFEITVIDDDNFYFIDTWVANDGASNWTQGGYLQCGIGSAGNYKVSWTSSNTAIVNNTTLEAALSINATIQNHTFTRRKFGIGADEGNMAGTAILTIADGDKVMIHIKNVGGTGNSIPRHANISLIKCC